MVVVLDEFIIFHSLFSVGFVLCEIFWIKDEKVINAFCPPTLHTTLLVLFVHTFKMTFAPRLISPD
jgi:hypothetical protein